MSKNYAVTCGMCKSGVIKVKDQIFQHLQSKDHKRKCFFYTLDFYATEADGSSSLPPDLLAEAKKLFCSSTIVVNDEFSAVLGDFPSLSVSPAPVAAPVVAAVCPAWTTPVSALPPSRGRGRGRLFRASEVPAPPAQEQVPQQQPQSSAFVPAPVFSPPASERSFASGSTMENGDAPKLAMAKRIYRECIDKKKEPLQAVNEISKCMRWQCDYVSVPPLDVESYRYELHINGALISAGGGPKQQDAKRKACSSALHKVLEMINVETEECPDSIRKTPMDIYGEMSFGKLKQIRNACLKLVGNVELPAHFAAFIITAPGQSPQEGTIVAFGTGANVSPLKNVEIMEGKGQHLLDMRALTVAKRAFQVFLASQLKSLFLKPNDQYDLFIDMEENGKMVTLREGFRVHLFLSHAPDGDATFRGLEQPHDLSQQELERDLAGRLEPIPVNVYAKCGLLRTVTCQSAPRDLRLCIEEATQNCFVNDEDTVKVMSLSDKLLMWNHVGFQGSLLSQFFRYPVRAYSIQVGQGYHHGDMARALFTRLALVITSPNGASQAFNRDMPTNFQIDSSDDAYLGRLSQTPLCYSRVVEQYSFNWFYHAVTKQQSPAEAVSVSTGLVVDHSNKKMHGKCSRLSKVGHLQRYHLLVHLASNYFSTWGNRSQQAYFNTLRGNFGSLTYRDLKQINGACNLAHRRIRIILRSIKLGFWIDRDAALQKFTLSEFFTEE